MNAPPRSHHAIAALARSPRLVSRGLFLFLGALVAFAATRFWHGGSGEDAHTHGGAEGAVVALGQRLGATPPEKQLALLVEQASRAASSGMRYAAVDLLGERKEPEAADALENAFRDNASRVRQRAVEALPQSSALLVVQRGPNAGARFLLDSERTTAGRAADSDIFLDDVTVSRRHAEFGRVGEGYRVVDVGSLNGTYVNRQRIESAVLNAGDEVQIGKYRLVYHPSRQHLVPADGEGSRA